MNDLVDLEFTTKHGERPPATRRVQLLRKQRGSAESILELVFWGSRSGPSRTCANARAGYAARVRGARHLLPKSPLTSGCFASSRAFRNIAASRQPAPQILGGSAAKVFSPPFTRTEDGCVGRAGILGSIPEMSGSSEQR